MEEKTNSSVGQTINLVIGTIIFIVFIILVFQRVDKALKIQAVDQCARSSRYEKNLPAENGKVSYPVLDIYQRCLKDKGY